MARRAPRRGRAGRAGKVARHRVGGWRGRRTVADLNIQDGPPHVLVAHTTFGKGVSFMEQQIKWHYWPMSDAEYQQALAEIGAV